MTPALLVRPTVGLIPTTELELEGERIEPSVSVPSDTATKLAATDIAEPLLDPQGSADRTYGFCNKYRKQNVLVFDIPHLFSPFLQILQKNLVLLLIHNIKQKLQLENCSISSKLLVINVVKCWEKLPKLIK